MKKAARTSSKTLFFALMMAMLRAFTHDSFSSGLTARNTRFGACKKNILTNLMSYEIHSLPLKWCKNLNVSF